VLARMAGFNPSEAVWPAPRTSVQARKERYQNDLDRSYANARSDWLNVIGFGDRVAHAVTPAIGGDPFSTRPCGGSTMRFRTTHLGHSRPSRAAREATISG
jgi:hypothetical protein